MIRQILPIILLAVFLSACAAPAPTATSATLPVAAPTSVPLPTHEPVTGPTPVPINVTNVERAKQPNGNIKTTAKVTAQDNLGLGQMEVASPDTMLMGETRTIRLQISPAAQLASMTPVAAPGKTPDLPKFLYKFSGNVQLYPVMVAELRSLSFKVDRTGPIRRDVSPSVPAVWDWLVSPLSPGQQELAIEISIPAVINGVDSELNTLQDVPIAIVVQSSAPTPVPFADQLSISIANNAGAIVVALIGLIGTLVGILVKLRSDQDKGEPKKPRK